MLVTQIIACTICGISLIMCLGVGLCCFLKNVTSTPYGFLSILVFIILINFPFVVAEMILFLAPDVFGIAYIFIFAQAFFLIIPYAMSVGTLIFTKKYIYRLNNFLIPKKYSYNDVIRYRMKYSSDIIYSRFSGPSKVITYDFEIWFTDGEYSLFCADKPEDRKVQYIKNILEENRCKKNGKIPEKNKK